MSQLKKRANPKHLPAEHLRDAVEPKLFGIGSESCTVGSAEFYLGYCITRGKLLCLDAGHFHPTESIADKLSSVLLYLPEILRRKGCEVIEMYCEPDGDFPNRPAARSGSGSASTTSTPASTAWPPG